MNLGSLEPSSGHFNRFFCSLDDFDTDIVNFVRKSRQHNDNFQQELHDLAKVEIVSYSESENAVKVIPVLTPVSILLVIWTELFLGNQKGNRRDLLTERVNTCKKYKKSDLISEV